MLNILVSFLTLTLLVTASLFNIKLNNIKSIFYGMNTSIVERSIEYDMDDSCYFNKEILMEDVKTYFSSNIKNDFKLTYYFKKDNEMTISDEPNKVQIKLNVDIYNSYKFEDKINYYINGRSVSKDWYDNY